MLQIAPGKEREAASALESESLVYEGLGKYDLLAIVEEDGLLFLDERKSFLNRVRGRFPTGILDWMAVCGFKWSYLKKPTKPINGSTIIGVCCIKLDLQKKTNPIKHEVNFVEKIYENLDNVHIYSGLGYYEILCLIERETIDDLSIALNKIKEIGISDGEQSLIMDINTIPCVRFREIDKDSSIRGNVKATIAINLKTGIPLNIDDIVTSCFGNSGHQIFGFHDALISTDMPLGGLLSNILRLRCELADSGLYSTCTLVKHEGVKTDIAPPIPWSRMDAKETPFKINEKTPTDLIYYSDLYNIIRNDPFTCELIRNLQFILETQIQFYTQAYTYLGEGDIRKFSNRIRTYNSILDIMNATIQQRLNGVLFGNLLGGKGVSFEAVGGIQRLIYALEAVPSHLLSALKLSWKGFCLFGHCHSYRSWFTHEVLAMPREYMLLPDKFWGMNHETGHIAFLRLDEENPYFRSVLRKLYKENEVSIRKYISENLKDSKTEPISEDEIIDFYNYHYSDVFSDMFDFSYGFKGDWDLYKDTVRSYLFTRGALTFTQITRALLVYQNLGPGLGVPSEKARESFFDELKLWLRKMDKSLDSNVRKKAELLADELQPAASIFATDMQEYLKKLDHTSIEKDVQSLSKSFAKGHIVIAADPTLVVKALLTPKLTPRARFSAILSMYDYGREHYLSL